MFCPVKPILYKAMYYTVYGLYTHNSIYNKQADRGRFYPQMFLKVDRELRATEGFFKTKLCKFADSGRCKSLGEIDGLQYVQTAIV